jgi:hypothetical protein
LSKSLESLKTNLPQNAETQAAFSQLSSEVTATISDTQKNALADLVLLKNNLKADLSSYVGLENKLEVTIEAVQKQMGVPVDPASMISFEIQCFKDYSFKLSSFQLLSAEVRL